MVPTSEGGNGAFLGRKDIREPGKNFPETGSGRKNEVRYLFVSGKMIVSPGQRKPLFIAQPSLSQVLKEIENDLGFRIFKKRPQRGNGDGKGKSFVGSVRGSIQTLEGNGRKTGRIQDAEKGNCDYRDPYMNLGACILPVVVPVFRRRYPGIKVFIRENNSKELEK